MKNKILKFLYFKNLGDDLYLIGATEILDFANSLNSLDLCDLAKIDYDFYKKFIVLAWELRTCETEDELITSPHE